MYVHAVEKHIFHTVKKSFKRNNQLTSVGRQHVRLEHLVDTKSRGGVGELHYINRSRNYTVIHTP